MRGQDPSLSGPFVFLHYFQIFTAASVQGSGTACSKASSRMMPARVVRKPLPRHLPDTLALDGFSFINLTLLTWPHIKIDRAC
jgi:hypothetical protein